MTETPLDHPSQRSATRLYVALTNHCNRACPWCSTHSSPRRATYMSPTDLARHFPAEGPFELQLEGGEPTTHPQLFDFVDRARAEPRLTRLVLCTNGVQMPREPASLVAWLARFGEPLIIKLSINHHLLARDAGLLDLATALAAHARARQEGFSLVLNVRRRRGARDDDAWVMTALRERDLAPYANDFFLQRYGRASSRAEWDAPFVVRDDFVMVNPDGTRYAADLIARSAGMAALP